MIIAAIIVFNEERMLPGCLESIRDQVDRIVMVDGAYALFPHEVPWSTDRTREIARCYQTDWIPCPEARSGAGRAWQDQVEKRNAYLVGDIGDWYLIIDADNRLIGTLPEPQSSLSYLFRSSDSVGQATWVLRLVQHRSGMRYEGSHCGLRWDGGWLHQRALALSEMVRVDPEVCRYKHVPNWRSAERIQARRKFYAWQTAHERPFRQRHGL